MKRGRDFVSRIFQATIEELAGKGYEGLAIPEVAARAGANKTSVYRRWPTKADLVGAALADAMTAAEAGAEGDGTVAVDPAAPVDLRSEMLRRLRHAASFATSPTGRGALRTMLAQGEAGAAAEVARALLAGPPSENPFALLEAAKAKGEVAAGLDTALVLTVLAGAVLHRSVVEGREPDEGFLESLADLVLEGATRRS